MTKDISSRQLNDVAQRLNGLKDEDIPNICVGMGHSHVIMCCKLKVSRQISQISQSQAHSYLLQRFIREYTPIKWGNCRKNLPVLTNLTFIAGVNQFNVSGVIQVKEKVVGKLKFTIETVKCSLNMKECQRYVEPLTFYDLCEMFERKFRFYTSTFESIEPPLRCPIIPGNHTISTATIDLAFVAIIPLDGSMWVVTFKVINSKTDEIIMCLNSETKIVRKRVRD